MTPGRTVLLLNEGAGSSGALADAGVLAPLRARGGTLQIVVSRGPDDLEQSAARAVRGGATLVVAGGGDGTLNEVLNGVASVRGGLSRVSLGLLPLGTGNDFARTLDIPLDVPEAVARIASGCVRELDVVRLDGRYFLNASGGGFTAETSSRVPARLKAWLGRAAYLLGGVRALQVHAPVITEVRLDDRLETLRMQLFAVCNGRSLGGGHALAPDADPGDGWLDVCIVHGESTLDLLTVLPQLSSGATPESAQVIRARVRRVSFRFARPTKVNVDGEPFVTSRCHYAVLPGAVRFVC